MPAILKAVANAGARFAGYVPFRLPFVLDDLFSQWLQDHFPDRKEKVLNRVKEIRGGKLNDGNFGSRMRGEGKYAEQLRSMFEIYCRKEGLNLERLKISPEHFKKPTPQGEFEF